MRDNNIITIKNNGELSMTVLIIALLHGIPVYAVGIWKQSKIWMTIALIISVALGVNIGNPNYMAVDIASSLIGYIAGWIEISHNSSKAYTSHTNRPSVFLSKLYNIFGTLLVFFVVVGGLYLYSIYSEPHSTSNTTVSDTVHPSKVAESIRPSLLHNTKPRHAESKKTVKRSDNAEAKASKEAYCLTLSTDAEILGCMDSY